MNKAQMKLFGVKLHTEYMPLQICQNPQDQVSQRVSLNVNYELQLIVVYQLDTDTLIVTNVTLWKLVNNRETMCRLVGVRVRAWEEELGAYMGH